MADHQSKRGVRIAALAGIACFGLAAAGCSSSPSTAASGGSSASASASAKPTGTVNVAYASSLQFLNEKVVSPAFTKAEGYTFSGRGASSGDLEADIAGGEISPNVFQSVGGDNITPLQPKFTTWYVQYAGTSMVVAYNPSGPHASEFKAIADGSKPLCSLFSSALQTPGLKLGRTDPNVDPQGRDFIYMLQLAQSYCHLPSDTVAKILGTSDFGTASSSQIYAESSLDSTLQAGSSTRPARSSPRPPSCTWPTSSCRTPSTWAASRTPRRTRRPPSSSKTAWSSRAARRSSTSPPSARPPRPESPS